MCARSNTVPATGYTRLQWGLSREARTVTTGTPESQTRRISDKGWVVIPQDLRQKYGLEAGTSVRFIDYGEVVAIVPVPSDPVRKGFGLFRGRSLTDRLLQERKQEQTRERHR